MYTQCPECNTAFRITTDQLREGQGQVNCSKCGALFDAISSLSDVAFEDHFSDHRKLPTLPLEQALSPPIDREHQENDGISTSPNWNRSRRSASWLSRTAWVSGIGLLMVLLGIQVSFLDGADLRQDPDLRPWFETVCERLRCELPSYRDPAGIDVLEQSLRPVGPDALEFRVVMINGSRFRQAFPRLKLDLIKFNGEPLARRVFSPEEYFPDAASHPSHMPVGKPFEIRLKIANPDNEVGGYHFNLI